MVRFARDPRTSLQTAGARARDPKPEPSRFEAGKPEPKLEEPNTTTRKKPIRRACGARRAACLVIAAFLGVGPGSSAPAEEAPTPPAARPNTWYASTVAQSQGAFLVTHFWSKGPLMRAETVVAGRQIVTIVTPTTYYTIDPVRGFGVGIERSELARSADATRVRPFGDEYEMLLRSGGELVRNEELGGQPVEVYRLTNAAGRVQVWVTPNSKLPIRVERTLRSSGHQEQISYVDWLTGIEIAPSFFEPDSRLAIERIGYEEYTRRVRTEQIGPAPPLYAQLLHGDVERK